MDSTTVDEAVTDLSECIKAFLGEFDQRDVPTRPVTAVIEDGDDLAGSDIGQQPERFVEDHLIFPILDSLGYEVTPRPNSVAVGDDEYPDFRIDNLPEHVIGENKPLNDAATARAELRAYLDTAHHDYGIATDGFEWGLYDITIDSDGTATLEPVIPVQSMKPIIKHYARNQELVTYNDDLAGQASPQHDLASFFQTMGHHNIRTVISGLSRFHDTYAELLAGDGEYTYDGVDTPILEAIDAPADTGESERLAFAALLVDRLAFIRLMEDRGVLNLSLREEWADHDQGLSRYGDSFLQKELHPLFYDVLSEPPAARDGPQGFGQPPQFGGGLFEPVLPREHMYDVPDEVMRALLTVFIEGQVRTVINEAVHGSLLESYRGSGETDIAGQMAEWYGEITARYDAELDYVEAHIRPTLRGFAEK